MKLLLVLNPLFSISPQILNEINSNEQNEDPNLFVYISHFSPTGGSFVIPIIYSTNDYDLNLGFYKTSDLTVEAMALATSGEPGCFIDVTSINLGITNFPTRELYIIPDPVFFTSPFEVESYCTNTFKQEISVLMTDGSALDP